MKDEKRKWTQGKCPANYSHREVMKVATKAYNNIKSAKEWNIATVAKKEDDAKFLALVADVEKLKGLASNNSAGYNPSSSSSGGKNAWRYSRTSGQEEMEKNGIKYKWCTKDCHKKPQWCSRPICRTKVEFKKYQEKKESKE